MSAGVHLVEMPRMLNEDLEPVLFIQAIRSQLIVLVGG